MTRARDQRGTAVITAMLVVSVVAAITVSMMTSQRIDIRRTQQLITAQQARLYTDGALYWAKNFLSKPVSEDQVWPVDLPATPIANGQGVVRAQLYSTKERVNLNEVAKAENQPKAVNLWVKNAGIEQDKAQEIVQALAAWLNQQATPDFDERYLGLTPAYRAAHQPMLSVSELRLVWGVDAALFARLAPYAVVLPSKITGEAYVLHTVVILHGQELNRYTVLQPSTSAGKVSLKVIWQSFSAL